jgi:hypothetical protein
MGQPFEIAWLVFALFFGAMALLSVFHGKAPIFGMFGRVHWVVRQQQPIAYWLLVALLAALSAYFAWLYLAPGSVPVAL